MLVVRPAELKDVDQLFDLIQLSELGLSTLKISKERLAERIDDSVRVFSRDGVRPLGQPYVFVMEDHQREMVVGTSAIYSKVGGFQPFYSYEIKTVVKKSEDLGVEKTIQYLDLQTTHNGPTEIGSLFLSPDYWGGGHGRLLSLARFLFMADFLNRFESETIAEMRGVVNDDGNCPLWNALGSHFFQIGYPRAETQTLENKKFIAELMPRHPIYVPLLPPEAQEVLGQVHPKTVPAKIMLEEEGFAYRNFVDIFDGGPTLHAETAAIRTVRQSQQMTLAEISSQLDSNSCLIANQKLDFRAVQGPLIKTAEGQAIINQETAALLELSVGDTLRAVSPKVGRSISTTE